MIAGNLLAPFLISISSLSRISFVHSSLIYNVNESPLAFSLTPSVIDHGDSIFTLTSLPASGHLVEKDDVVVFWTAADSSLPRQPDDELTNARPHQDDYIGLYCGPQAHLLDFLFTASVDPTTTTTARPTPSTTPTMQNNDNSPPSFPLKNHNPPENVATHGQVRFHRLPMLRCTYHAVYVTNTTTLLTSDKWSPAVQTTLVLEWAPGVKTRPSHGRLARLEASDSMMLMYTTPSSSWSSLSSSSSTHDEEDEDEEDKDIPRVRYGLVPSHLTLHGNHVSSTTYNASDMCDGDAQRLSQSTFRDPGVFHSLQLSSLQPATTYHYQYGNPRSGWSSIESFKSPPSPNDVTATVKFIAYADMGTYDGDASTSTATRVYQEVSANGFDDFLLHFGDLSYARGRGWIWDVFFSLISPIATRVPYMVSVGNHEFDHTSGGKDANQGFHPAWGNYGNDSGGECGVPVTHRFYTPGSHPFWYLFSHGPVTIITLSSEHDFTHGSAQYRWLNHVLATVDRDVTPFVVLTAHRMMYTTSWNPSFNASTQTDGDAKVGVKMTEALEPLLYQYRVNLMMVGHQHNYERTCPVYQQVCQLDGHGTTHVVVGSAGYEIQTTGMFPNDWTVVHANEFGYLRVTATHTSLTGEFVLNHNGEIYDTFSLSIWD